MNEADEQPSGEDGRQNLGLRSRPGCCCQDAVSVRLRRLRPALFQPLLRSLAEADDSQVVKTKYFMVTRLHGRLSKPLTIGRHRTWMRGIKY